MANRVSDPYWDDMAMAILRAGAPEEQVARLHAAGVDDRHFRSLKATLIVRLQQSLGAISEARYLEEEA